MKYTKCEKCKCSISNSCLKKHVDACFGQGKRVYKGGTVGQWNKGLTKEDPRIAAAGMKISKAKKGKPGYAHSEEQKKALSIMAKARGFGGTTQSRWIEYRGVKLGSSYEVSLAKNLDENNVRWEKPKRFPYVDPVGQKRTYTPDFYLPDLDIYLDPKNDFLINNVNPSLGFSDKEKIKLAEEQNGILVLILSKTELTWEAVNARLASRLV